MDWGVWRGGRLLRGGLCFLVRSEVEVEAGEISVWRVWSAGWAKGEGLVPEMIPWGGLCMNGEEKGGGE